MSSSSRSCVGSPDCSEASEILRLRRVLLPSSTHLPEVAIAVPGFIERSIGLMLCRRHFCSRSLTAGRVGVTAFLDDELIGSLGTSVEFQSEGLFTGAGTRARIAECSPLSCATRPRGLAPPRGDLNGASLDCEALFAAEDGSSGDST